MNKRTFLACAVAAMSLTALQAQTKSMDQFVDELMSKMTVEEKIGQTNLLSSGQITTGNYVETPLARYVQEGACGSVLNIRALDDIIAIQKLAVEKSRLGIPLLVGMDVVHGYVTTFPLPLGLACTWDIPAIEESAHIAAVECSAEGVSWTYSPMVDIALDARWGRISEGAGEDPYLGSLIAAAMVRGYQGDDLTKPETIIACLKHFALYGGVEAGRDYNTVDMSRLRMFNQYLPPYEAAVKAGVGSVMTSFNLVDGIPATANRWLLEDVLRQKWGFDGFVVTDYDAIKEMTAHGLGDIQEVAARAMHAGTDMDMGCGAYQATLKKSLEDGLVTMEEIDKACRRVLEAKWKLGLFDDPYRYCDKERAERVVYCKEHKDKARALTAESLVLLKNEGVLPLKKEGKVALIGPLADSKYNVPGTWSVGAQHKRYNTLREAMANALEGKAELLYTQGCNVCDDEALQNNGAFYRIIPRVDKQTAMQEALDIAGQADVIICAMGEESEMSGEAASRSNLEMMDAQRDLLKELVKLGKPLLLLNYAGRPTVLGWESENVPAIMQVWFGSEAGDAICDVIFGDKVPCGKLTTSFPRATGQEPLYYNHLPTGRPKAEGDNSFNKFSSSYLDVSNDPLYPFGFGLSYTTFSYGDLTLDKTEMAQDGSITASITVTNTGDCDGVEVVQLYIHDLAASISRPVKELKAFERISLAKGESKEVTFTITPEMLKFYNYDIEYVLEPGVFDVMVGPDSALKNLKKATFTVL